MTTSIARTSPSTIHVTTPLTDHRTATRVVFLDVLRGLAALLVFTQHAWEKIELPFPPLTLHAIQLGQCGVTLFFLCSGYIIPTSLEKRGSLIHFWITRVFRLYPLYWFSLFTAIALVTAGLFPVLRPFYTAPLVSYGANFFMIQTFVGIPDAVGLYWSLAFELVFYVVVSALFAAGLHKRTVETTVVLLVLSLVVGIVPPLVFGKTAPIGLFFNIATMFVGTFVYRYHSRTISTKTLVRVLFLVVATIILTLSANFLGHDDPKFGGGRSFVPMLVAWLSAYSLFGIGFVLRWVTFPRALAYLGTISYSLYLMHPFILERVPTTDIGIVTYGLWLLILIVVASFTYRFIEQPSIALGRHIIRRISSGNAPAFVLRLLAWEKNHLPLFGRPSRSTQRP